MPPYMLRNKMYLFIYYLNVSETWAESALKKYRVYSRRTQTHPPVCIVPVNQHMQQEQQIPAEISRSTLIAFQPNSVFVFPVLCYTDCIHIFKRCFIFFNKHTCLSVKIGFLSYRINPTRTWDAETPQAHEPQKPCKHMRRGYATSTCAAENPTIRHMRDRKPYN